MTHQTRPVMRLSRTVIYYTIVIWAAILIWASGAFAQGLAFTEQELACFAKVDDSAFVPKVIEPKFNIRRGLRGCKTFACLQARARPSKNVLQVFVVKDLPDGLARAHHGNLGWAKKNVALIGYSANHLTNALLIARGVDSSDLGAEEWRIEKYLHDHNLFVEEVKCLRKTDRCKIIKRHDGQCEASFNEVQPVMPYAKKAS